MNGLNKEEYLRIYRKMQLIRRFEENAVKLFMAGEIPGFLHVYLNEEAVGVGVCSALKDDDYIISTHRGHGHVLAKGAKPDLMMAELFGRRTGYCHGKGGSMHIADFSLGIIGANGIVGAGLPIANGVALAAKMTGSGRVIAAFFGDGASNQGAFHEALNLASIWSLPVVFVCENNQYALSTPRTYHQKIDHVADRAAAYKIQGVTVDGNDVLAVRQAAQEAVEKARSGGGPILLECLTYRRMGHYIGDPGVYRPKEEFDRWMALDPLPRYRTYLIQSTLASEEELGRIDQEIEDEITRAIEFARQSPWPDLSEATADVFFPTPLGLKAGKA
jgi:acetoin:2,6-dichlorophenolindophenol oxidoreductase subunit alpha